MNPFIEVVWNSLSWSSTVATGMHTSPVWDDFHSFEGNEFSTMYLKVLNHCITMHPQEIGSCQIPAEELAKGKTKEWVEIFSDGKVVGKVKFTANMYEERRTDMSTQNTSYVYIDLKEDYFRRLNELELEKEELEFYRMQYKKKQQKLQQDKKQYKSTLTEIVKKKTPQHTEESSDDIEGNNQMSGPTKLVNKLSVDYQKRVMYKTLNNQVAIDLMNFRSERTKGKKKSIKMSNTFAGGNLTFENRDEGSEVDSGILELRFNMSNQFETPKRGASPGKIGYATMGGSKSGRNLERGMFE